MNLVKILKEILRSMEPQKGKNIITVYLINYKY